MKNPMTGWKLAFNWKGKLYPGVSGILGLFKGNRYL